MHLVGFLSAAVLFAATANAFSDTWSAPLSAQELKSPLPKDKTALEAGRKLYMDRCSDCHGDNGKGNGPGASDLERRPRSFKDPKVQQQSDGELYWKLTQGRKPMPGYGKKLSDEQRWELVQFLRTFGK